MVNCLMILMMKGMMNVFRHEEKKLEQILM